MKGKHQQLLEWWLELTEFTAFSMGNDHLSPYALCNVS